MVSHAQATGLVAAAVPSLPKNLIPLLGQFVDPAHYAPQRLPDVTSASTVGTAVCTLCVADTMQWDPTMSMGGTLNVAQYYPHINGNTYTPIFDDQEARVVVSFRDPACMGVVTTGPFPNTSVTNLNCSEHYPGMGFRIMSGENKVELGTFTANGADRYGAMQLPARMGGGQSSAIWFDGAPAAVPIVFLDVTFASPPMTTFVLELRILYWTDDEDSRLEWNGMGTVNPGDLHCQFSVNNCFPASGYRSFVIVATPQTPNWHGAFLSDITIHATVSTQMAMCHVFHPSIVEAVSSGNSQPLIGQVRQLGNTVLISNSTAEMFKSGTVYARQIDGTVPWYQCAISSTEITSSNVHTMYDGPLSKGLYAVVKPQGEDCLSLEDLVREGGSAEDPCFSINFRPFATSGTVVALLVPSRPTANSPATSVVVHFFRGLEFTTQSQLFNVDVTSTPRATLLPFLDELSHFRQFYENPLHLRDISNAIKNAGRWAWDNKGTIKDIAKLLAEAAAVARIAL